MGEQQLISVQNVHRQFGPVVALKGISFSVYRGEVLEFLGPNGAGKSTTMQIISGALAPTSGSVTVLGHDLTWQPREAKCHLGYLPEFPPLYDEFTVQEYLEFCARLRGVARGEVAAAVATAKTRCSLSTEGGRLIGNLSRGFRQRIGIAQAIVHNPAIVILDEPTVGLDPIQIRGIRSLIRELGDNHNVILSTHILPEVQQICDRVLIINDGALVLDDMLDNLGANSETLRVRFAKPVQASELFAIAGVSQANELAPGHWRINCAPDTGCRDNLLRAALNQGWGLQELGTERDTLEDTFVALTCSDQATLGDPDSNGDTGEVGS